MNRAGKTMIAVCIFVLINIGVMAQRPTTPLTPEELEQENQAKAHAKAEAERDALIRPRITNDLITWLQADPAMADPRVVAIARCNDSIDYLPALKAQHDAYAPYVQNGMIPRESLDAAKKAGRQAYSAAVPSGPVFSVEEIIAKRAASPACTNIPICGTQICIFGYGKWKAKGWPGPDEGAE